MNHLKLWKVDGQGNKVSEWFYFWVLLIFSSGWLSNAQPTNAPTLHTLGREPWRPQFHFTPASQWMNDPNGMVYYEGEYHLFYQFNPFGDRWGHMSWGHAVSRDLVRWEHLPVALIEENDVMIFSGSAVVDWKNTSGFGLNGRPPLVAIYTGHFTKKPLQNQQIAFSNDRGRTWTKYSGNPVLDVNMADFRDPKVFWHEGSSRWVMTVALAAEKKVHFYTSPNLKQWKYVGEFGPTGAAEGLWECPDLFPLSVEGGGTKWVLIVNINPGGPTGGSGCQYFVGEFDGAKFTADPLPASRAEFVPSGKVIADFEAGYLGWKAEGEAFGTAPPTGTLPGQQAVVGFRGLGLVNSFKGGDRSQGTLTSEPFDITAAHLSFLIGGGALPETRLDLRVDGKVVRTATGRETEQLRWQSWDVRALLGQRAELQIVDRASGGWGHLNVDHILLADEAARSAVEPVLWADYGADFYAGVSWSDIPAQDGRRLWLGWMSNWSYANDVPTSPWRSAMSIPRELTLQRTPEGLRLVQRPVRELAKLRGKHHRLAQATLADAKIWLAKLKPESRLLEIAVEFENIATIEDLALRFITGENEFTVIRWQSGKNQLSLDRTRSGRVDFHPKFAGVHEAPLAAREGRLQLKLFLDTSSLEVFASEGNVVLTDLILPSLAPRRLELSVGAGAPDGQVRNLEVWELQP